MTLSEPQKPAQFPSAGVLVLATNSADGDFQTKLLTAAISWAFSASISFL